MKKGVLFLPCTASVIFAIDFLCVFMCVCISKFAYLVGFELVASVYSQAAL